MKSLQIVKDDTRKVFAALKQLTQQEVLVGIPEDKSARQSGEITNAALGYIHNFGAPGANIPARPWLIPGIQKSRDQFMPYLTGAASAAMDGKSEIAKQELMRAGQVAVNGVKRELTTGNFVPLSPATVAARYRARGAQRPRKGEVQYAALLSQGLSPATAQAQAGIRPLINTAQMLNSVTYVVRRK